MKNNEQIATGVAN